MTEWMHIKFLFLHISTWAFGLTFVINLTGELSAQNSSQTRVLIVDGFSNHDWKQTTKVFKWILEGSGRYAVEVSTVPLDSIERRNWNPDFTEYDLVVQNTNNIHNTELKWPEQAQRNLENYVKNGGGMFVLHSANNAFPEWIEYNKMIGLGWRPAGEGIALEIDSNRNIIRYQPGEGKGTGHGERFDALIQILNRHPINEGFPESWKTANTEVYSFPRGPAQNLTVLSFAYDSTDTGRMWPVEWVVNYGKGRVYSSSMGHLWEGEIYPEAYRCAGFQTTVVRVAEWLATGQVTFPVPEDFPSGNSPSLRPQQEFLIEKHE